MTQAVQDGVFADIESKPEAAAACSARLQVDSL